MTDRPEVPFPVSTLSRWLEQSNDLLALTSPSGALQWANAHFVSVTGLDAKASANLLALAPAEVSEGESRRVLTAALELGFLDETELEVRGVDGATVFLRARATDVSGRMLWTFQDTTPMRRLSAQASRQTELLEMAQEFGRLGVWERDIPSGKGHWDRHVFGFWGLAPHEGTPDFEQAVQQIDPDDRTLMNFAEST